MQIPQILLIITVELGVLLAVAGIFIALLRRRRTRTLSATPAPTSQIQAEKSDYFTYIDQQLLATQQHYQRTFSSKNIQLDSTHPPMQQACALRYYFLRAEKKATHPNGSSTSWAAIEHAMADIIKAYQPPPVTTDNSAQETLFEQLDRAWETTQEAAQSYHLDLTTYAQEHDSDELIQLIEQFQQCYNDFSCLLRQQQPEKQSIKNDGGQHE